MHIQIGTHYLPVSGNNLSQNKELIEKGFQSAARKFSLSAEGPATITFAVGDDESKSLTIIQGDQTISGHTTKRGWSWDKPEEGTEAGEDLAQSTDSSDDVDLKADSSQSDDTEKSEDSSDTETNADEQTASAVESKPKKKTTKKKKVAEELGDAQGEENGNSPEQVEGNIIDGEKGNDPA